MNMFLAVTLILSAILQLGLLGFVDPLASASKHVRRCRH
jgi:hypothetical protein